MQNQENFADRDALACDQAAESAALMRSNIETAHHFGQAAAQSYM